MTQDPSRLLLWGPVGSWLRAERDARDLSRREVANAVGTTERSLARWEDEGKPPPADDFLRLVMHYGIAGDIVKRWPVWLDASRQPLAGNEDAPHGDPNVNQGEGKKKRPPIRHASPSKFKRIEPTEKRKTK